MYPKENERMKICRQEKRAGKVTGENESPCPVIRGRSLTMPVKKQQIFGNHGYGLNSISLISILIGIVMMIVAIPPACAGEQYMAGAPDLTAYLAGTNEFSPGQEVVIPVIVENSGTNQFKFVKMELVSRDDLPNTAKFLTVTLEPGDSPFIIKSDPQMLGDLRASSTATGMFTVRIPDDTTAGTYTIPVKLNYTYLYDAEQFGVDTVKNYYRTKEEVKEITVRVKPDVRVGIVTSQFRDLNAGTEGSITLTVKNTGHEDGRKAILIIARNDGSPVIPTQPNAYIGDFPAGSTATAVFRATVSGSAEAQTYPLDVFVKYEDRNGDTLSSDIETIGVPVNGKIAFAIVSEPETMSPGEKKTVTVLYKNTGDATARHAQARVSMVDPFTSNDDTAYLGDIAPGETRSASFLITAERSATLKNYGLDSEIRYRDGFDNQIISDPVKLPLQVEEEGGILKNPVLLLIIAIIVIGAGYAIYRKRAGQ